MTDYKELQAQAKLELSEAIKGYSVLDMIAQDLMMFRRGNPDMGGPNPSDYKNAEKLMWKLSIPIDTYCGELKEAIDDFFS